MSLKYKPKKFDEIVGQSSVEIIWLDILIKYLSYQILTDIYYSWIK